MWHGLGKDDKDEMVEFDNAEFLFGKSFTKNLSIEFLQLDKVHVFYSHSLWSRNSLLSNTVPVRVKSVDLAI